MKFKSILIIMSAVVMFAIPLRPALADVSGAETKLSLAKCIESAMKNQTDILLGENSAVSARNRETQAKSGYYPTVSIDRTVNYAHSRVTTSDWNDGSSLSVTQNIYDGGLREARLKSAGAAVTQSDYQTERIKQTTIYNVTRDYFALLKAKNLANVKEASVKYLEGQRELVNTRVAVGDAAQVDILPVESQLANSKYDLLSARNSVLTAAITLQNTMGISPTENFDIEDEEIKETEIKPVEYYLDRALLARPEIMQDKAAIEAAKASAKTAEITLKPHPSINGKFDQSLIGSGKNTTTITGGVSYNLFDGGNNRAAYNNALTGVTTASLNAEQRKKDIAAGVRTAYLNVINAKERVAASAVSLNAAEKNFEAQKGRYKQGLAIPLDLLNAEVAVITAKNNEVQARYDYFLSYTQLEYAIGIQGGSNEN